MAQENQGILLSFEEQLKAVLVLGRLYVKYKFMKEKRYGEREIDLIPLPSDPRPVALDIGANKSRAASNLDYILNKNKKFCFALPLLKNILSINFFKLRHTLKG